MKNDNNNIHWFVLLLSIFSFIFDNPLAAFENDNGSTEPVIIHNVRIFDGKEIIPENTVVIENGMIREITDSKPVIPGADIIDGAGGTLLPGFIDSHVHAFGPALEQALIFGVTTVLDMFIEHNMAAQLRREQQERKVTNRADLFSAGTIVTAPGGHGTQYGLPIPTITSPDEADEFVQARIDEGSDYIKIVYDDGSTYGISFPTLDKETLAAVIGAAHKYGKLSVVHISRMDDAGFAIEAGADGFAHIFVDRIPDEEFVSLAVSKEIFIIPTLTVMENFDDNSTSNSLVDDPHISSFLSPEDITNLQQRFPENPHATARFSFAREAVRQLHNAGVPILAGSDAPNPGTVHGASIHRELELLVEAGLSPIEALRAATSLPAKHFGLSDRGKIEPGVRADILLVHGDPTKDILATRDIHSIWKLGVKVNRETYRKRVEEAKQLAEEARSLPPPQIPETGLIGDFEDGKLSSTFGFGWNESTDEMMGGRSTVELGVVKGGSNDSNYAMRIGGRIDGAIPFAWAGAMFFPAEQPMIPANLSDFNGIEFRARGDGRTYFVLMFSQGRGPMPISRPFQPEERWKSFSISFKDFDGIDGSDITGIMFSAGPPEGEFELMIDHVCLIRK